MVVLTNGLDFFFFFYVDPLYLNLGTSYEQLLCYVLRAPSAWLRMPLALRSPLIFVHWMVREDFIVFFFL